MGAVLDAGALLHEGAPIASEVLQILEAFAGHPGLLRTNLTDEPGDEQGIPAIGLGVEEHGAAEALDGDRVEDVDDMPGLEDMMDLGWPVCFDVTHSTQLPGGGGTHTAGRPERAPLLARCAGVGGDGPKVGRGVHRYLVCRDRAQLSPRDLQLRCAAG